MRDLTTIAAGVTALALLAAAPVQATPTQAGPPAASPPAGAPRIYEMEQIRTGPIAADVLQKLQATKTLQEAEEILKVNRVGFSWSAGEVRSTSLPPGFVAELDKLPPHEVFLIPQAAGVTMGVILRIRREASAPPQ
ncbi:MAG: hypothetical protein ACJ798_13480 [Phenylobacterium sp.]